MIARKYLLPRYTINTEIVAKRKKFIHIEKWELLRKQIFFFFFLCLQHIIRNVALPQDNLKAVVLKGYYLMMK